MRTGRSKLAFAAVATLATVGAGVMTAQGASAATAEMPLQCGGQTLTVRTPQSTNQNWGSGQVVGGGHLVVKSFEFTLFDDTAGVVLLHEEQSHGAAHAMQDTIRCTVDTSTEVIGEAPDGFVWPEGTSPTDVGTYTVAVEVVPFLSR